MPWQRRYSITSIKQFVIPSEARNPDLNLMSGDGSRSTFGGLVFHQSDLPLRCKQGGRSLLELCPLRSDYRLTPALPRGFPREKTREVIFPVLLSTHRAPPLVSKITRTVVICKDWALVPVILETGKEPDTVHLVD